MNLLNNSINLNKKLITSNFLLILAGLPASGKTTIAYVLKKLLEMKQQKFHVKIVDTDQIRTLLTPHQFDPKKEYLVRNKSLNEVESGLKRGFIVISDDLNYYTSMRHDLKEIAEKMDISYFILYINTPIKKCIEWNKKRGEPIPKEVIIKIDKKFDTFNSYKWDNPIFSIDPSKVDNLKKTLEQVINLIGFNLKVNSKDTFHKKAKTDIDLYREKLDMITRNWIRDNINQDKYQLFKREILKLRKKFIKRNKNKIISETQILKQFLEFIKRNIKIESS